MSGIALAPHDAVPGRPFADPAHTREDTAILERIRATLRDRLTATTAWREPRGESHLVVLPDPDGLAALAPAVAVGFFGQARAQVDHRPIGELEHAILARADSYAGLLAYCNVFFADRGQWGNLVVFRAHGDPAGVAGDAEHARAIALTPRHYDSLRLHRYELADGALGAAPLAWVRTTYLDFADDPPWRAVRSAAPA